MDYFPSLYPDETLYSGLARYHQRVGGSSHSSMMDLFGVSGLGAVTDLPCHLNRLSNLINGVYTSEELLMKHTLFPYYATFLPKSLSNELRRVMFESNAKTGKAHALAGLLASVIKHPEKLRYCATCAKTDIRLYGESYWHRIHQLPGVHICPTHKEHLRLSTVPYISKTKYVSHSISLLDTTQTLENFDFLNFEQLHQIAELSFVLLKSGFIDVELIYQSYRVELENRHLISLNGGIRFQGILSQFEIFFGAPMLDFLCCMINTKSADTWLHKLVRDPKNATHPLRHIMIMIFLNISFDSEMERPNSNVPFGKGPWPCLNKAAEHYRQDVITECTLSNCSRPGKPIGIFECSCGFIYARKGPDLKLADRYLIGKVKNYGGVWTNKLLELTRSNELSLLQIARDLNVSSKTIHRHFKLNDEHKTAEVKLEFVSQKQEIRNVLLSSMSGIENRTRSNISQTLSKEYNWLYKHDKEWLLEQLPQKSLRRLPSKRINWNDRDTMLHSKLQHEYKEIYKEQSPVRVTVTELGRRTGHYIWLAKKIDLLPLCRKFIQENRESTERFQFRRLEWAKELLLEQEGTIRGWKLLKLAGIPNHYSLIIRDKIVEIVKSYDEMFIYKLLYQKEVS